jgi:hypothetical protein
VARTRAGTRDDDAGSPVRRDDDAATLRVRPVGRPRLIDEPGTSLSVWLPVSAYDRFVKLADARRQSVSTYVREVLILVAGSRER